MISTVCAKVSSRAYGARRMVHVEARIAALGIELPLVPPEPKGNYVPFVKSGNMVYLSGHLPQRSDKTLITGRIGEDLTAEQGQAAARLVAINLIASLKAAAGDLDKVKRIVKVSGFVNSTNDFKAQPTVINGCSDLLAAVFLEKGSHARAALATNSLPLGVAVEIEAIVELEE